MAAQQQNGNPAGDVAICGIALRVPGADDVNDFWELVRNGRTTFTPVTTAESAESGYSASQQADPDFVSVRSALLGHDLFDPAAFGIAARDAVLMDPQQRVFLETVRRALDDAGYDQVRGMRIGIFGSSSSSTYLSGPVRAAGMWDETDINFSAMLANDKDFLCTRTSYALGLTGPSVVVQSACSSSLLAVHLARHALLRGECDAAVVGGVSISLPHLGGYLARTGSIFSPSGTCRPFDQQADGTVKAHGAAAVVLLRLEDAPQDRVYARVAGSAVNNDGSDKVGFPAPSVSGQAAVIRDALASARLTAGDVRYVETHGTATPLGDPIEIRGLRQARGSAGACYLGSTKANLGHLDAAAGVTGLVKAALVLERGIVPPLAGLGHPSPLLELDDTLKLPMAEVPAPWLEAAGVSSFGMGGTNVHVVLRRREDAAPRPLAPWGRAFNRTRQWLDQLPVPAAATALAATPGPEECATADPAALLAVARTVLQLPDLALDDNLVEAGADSLALIDLLAEIRDHFGVSLDFAQIERVRSVRELAERLAEPTPAARSSRDVPAPAARDTSRAPVPANLVNIGPRGGRTLFLVHPAGGTSTCYAGLQPHLGQELGIVGLSFPQEFVGHRLSMRELASRYIAAMRERQPTGPYLLGGYSFGGNLAAEMAIQLEEQGQSVEQLVMFDSHPPHAYTGGNCADSAYVKAFPALLEALIPDVEFAQGHASAASADEVLAAVIQPHWSASVRAELSSFFSVWCENHGILKRWTPDRQISCPVLIFEASQSEPPEVLERLDIAASTVHEWNRYLEQPARILPVTGDHYSIFRNPEAMRVMGRALQAELCGVAVGA